MRKIFLVIIFLSLHPVVEAQTVANDQKALTLAKQAIDLADKRGAYTDALQLLVQAKKLDPRNVNFAYETAYVYYQQKKYDLAIKELKPLVNGKKAPDARFYQLLGNAYDLNKQTDKAISVYKSGIKRFPEAGQLYLELGGIAYQSGNNDGAVDYWEQGIQNAPTFASNYYWAGKLYCMSSEKIWGIFYCELFLLLEPNSARTVEISTLLYKTYNSAVVVNPNSSWQNWVCFSERARMYTMLGAAEQGEVTPFQVALDETLTKSLLPEMKSKNISALYQLRDRFIEQWEPSSFNSQYPNLLFDWWKQVKAAGHLEAYSYWVFKNGNPEEFQEWQKKNDYAYSRFLQWYQSHPLKLNAQQRFFRLQYL
jgi:hypothetical protein